MTGRLMKSCIVAFMLCMVATLADCLAGQPGAPAGPHTSVQPRQRVEDGNYDPLPPRFSAMNHYDKIALEPYRDKYDAMPLHEKAHVYSQAFAFMNDRQPRFSPVIVEQIRASEQAGLTRNVYDAKKFLYKPPPPPRAHQPDNPDAELVSKIPVPWATSAPETAPETHAPNDGPDDDYRMETLRRGRFFNSRERR